MVQEETPAVEVQVSEAPETPETPVTPEVVTTPRQEASRYYTTKQIAEEFHFGTPWITKLIHQGRIKAHKPFGKSWRIPPEEYERIKRDGIPAEPRERPGQDGPRKIFVPKEKADKILPQDPPDPAEPAKEKSKWPWSLFDI